MKEKIIIDDDYTKKDLEETQVEPEEFLEEEIIEEENDFEIYFRDGQNKHKLEGKHSLDRDVIFNGKLENVNENSDNYNSTDFDYSNEFSKFDALSLSDRNDVFIQKELEEDVFNILNEKTDLDFSQNRRKPKREDFNDFFKLLVNNLKAKYSHSELFVCLSYYFTDNIYNMFKILDKKFVSVIIRELKDKGSLKDIGNVDFI